VFWVISV